MSKKEKMTNSFVELATTLEKSVDQYISFDGTELGKRAMALKASACIIRFDIMRHFYVFEHFQDTGYKIINGYARLKVVADQVKTIIEARNWFQKKANKELREIAIQKGLGADVFDKQARELRAVYNMSELDKYKALRASVSAHYDLRLAEELIKLGELDSERFFKDVEGVVHYINKWIQILVEVFENNKIGDRSTRLKSSPFFNIFLRYNYPVPIKINFFYQFRLVMSIQNKHNLKVRS